MRKKALKADWRKIAHTLKKELDDAHAWMAERKKMLFDSANQVMKTEEERDDALAQSKLNHALLTEASENLAMWKRIWSVDHRYYYEQAQKQADTIAALVQGNKALRSALDKHELFHVRSKELRA